MLDIEVCKEITILLEKLTTTGKDILDNTLLKQFLIKGGQSDEYLKLTHEKVLHQLEQNHSEIRYGTLLVIEQLFKRSKAYRKLLIADTSTFLELTLETNFNKLLPKPYAVAKKLKRKSLQLIQYWHSEFRKENPEISSVFQYVKTKLKIDFDDALKRTTAEVESARQLEERQARINQSKLDILKVEINENYEEILRLLSQMSNCFALLIPKPENLFESAEPIEKAAAEEQKADEDNDDADINEGDGNDGLTLREHGISLLGATIKINMSQNAMSSVQCTKDNQILFDNLKEMYMVIRKRLLPKFRSWIKAASEASDLELFKRIIDLKNKVQEEITRYEKLNIQTEEKSDSSDDSDDSDDFEDVPEKEHFEEFAIAPPVPAPRPVPNSSYNAVPSTKHPEASSWSLWGNSDNDPDDPTTRCATVKRSKRNSDSTNTTDTEQPCSSKSILQNDGAMGKAKSNTRKEKLLQQAPKVPFDIDLYHWEDENLTAPSVELVESDSHRFWQPSDREGEVIEAADGVASLRTRTIEFTGRFEPVKWTCRVPLPNGKLCPRKDRIKCPFHGIVIGRDENGNPTKDEDIAKLADKQAQEEKDKPPDWQDPAYLRDLQAQIGIDLTIKPSKKGSRKKKTFAEKYPGLTDLSKEKKSSRARLARKVMSRNSLKRVGQALDSADYKKFNDKFGDQYNYAYNND